MPAAVCGLSYRVAVALRYVPEHSDSDVGSDQEGGFGHSWPQLNNGFRTVSFVVKIVSGPLSDGDFF